MTMFSIRSILLRSLPLISTVLSTPIPTASSVQDIDSILSSDQGKAAFQDLFKDLSEESLHAALRNHLYPKIKDGIYEFDHLALDNAQTEIPPLATQLLMSAAVRMELVKRQTNETAASAESTSPPPAASTTENIQPSETRPPPQTSDTEPPPRTSTEPPPPPQTSTQESSPAVSTPDPTIAVPVTIVSSGQTLVSSVLQPGGVLTTTNSAGAPVVLTTPRPTTPTAVTRTDENGSSFVTTLTPSVGRVTSVFTRTSTNPAGSTVVTFETQIIEVAGATPEETGVAADGQGGDTTQTAEPGLQSEGAGFTWGVDRAMMMGGAMGVAAILI